MKYLKIPMIILFTFQFTYAQLSIEKGIYNISGSIHYENVEYGGHDNMNYLDISPGIYYFIHKNISLGSQIVYSRTLDKHDAIDHYTIKPGIRLYFLSGYKINPYLILSYEYYLADYTHGKDYLNVFGFNYGCGMDYFITENIAIEPYFIYSKTKWKDEDDEILRKPKTIEFGVSLAIFINKEKSNQ